MESTSGNCIQTPSRPLRGLEIRLYVSHFLTTWNSRLFEFAAVLFLASTFPQTLLPMSVYALARSAATVIFAQALGTAIDKMNRLAVVQTSIIGQRLATAASCGVFWALEQQGAQMQSHLKSGLFGLVVALACAEKLCSVLNLVSIERDWVVVITEGNEEARRVINARIRRIDLFCKLVGPLSISFVMISSTMTAIWTTLAMNVCSVIIECVCISRVYQAVPSLWRQTTAVELPENQTSRRHESGLVLSRLRVIAHQVIPVTSLPFYFRHPAFLPSFALSLLYFTVLSFTGQMITYLISVGYSSVHIGVARAVSTVFELTATWIAPRMMNRIGIIRGGIWSLSWQMLWLAAAMSLFFVDFQGQGTGSLFSATGLAVGVALSRVGLWGYDLCAQNIIQDEVESEYRGVFSTVEVSFQNLFEMLSYATTIIFSRPDQFRWPVVISVISVYTAGGLYAAFVRKRRGHLFHAPPCMPKGEVAPLQATIP
ncbi:Ferroporti-1 [Microdochium trichocladiopsis]|uniref:Solute carrier family 40 member n=1 Tax=Microdochium trichocladiopsis TaxID=1682393 RepID=A0A9P8XWA8_9PEZI|nr:Ferroporti-1 [Microdochium trichocladiopsis]KAH7016310.1 Ferroporti-1 [Microdochium trichocladiopsis]